MGGQSLARKQGDEAAEAVPLRMGRGAARQSRPYEAARLGWFGFLTITLSFVLVLLGEHLLILTGNGLPSHGNAASGDMWSGLGSGLGFGFGSGFGSRNGSGFDFTARRGLHFGVTLGCFALYLASVRAYAPRISLWGVALLWGHSGWHVAFLYAGLRLVEPGALALIDAVLVGGYGGSVAGVMLWVYLYLQRGMKRST